MWKRPFNILIEMKSTEQLKILHDKIKANQTQYDLSTEAVKISVLPLKSVDKYAYLTFEDLGYKPGLVKQAKFEVK